MKEKAIPEKDRLNNSNESSSIVLYNDDINTFNFVIRTLVEVCGHDPVQAEQCAMIVHLKGSCEVKHGSPESLSAMCRMLNEKGLTAKISRY